MEILFIAILIGLLPALIAYSKERNFFLWWAFGAALFIVALPAAILMGPARRCIYCDLDIRKNAVICPHCGQEALSDAEITALAHEPD